jgi:hypothetical protein
MPLRLLQAPTAAAAAAAACAPIVVCALVRVAEAAEGLAEQLEGLVSVARLVLVWVQPQRQLRKAAKIMKRAEQCSTRAIRRCGRTDNA